MGKYFVSVKFKHYDKIYDYIISDKIHFEPNIYYQIETADGSVYSSPVMLYSRTRKATAKMKEFNLKEIVKATPVDKFNFKKAPNFKKVIYNDTERTTTIYWNDFDFTTVKAIDGDPYSREAGFALCFLKKQLGSQFAKVMNNYCGDEKNYYFSQQAEKERAKRREEIKKNEIILDKSSVGFAKTAVGDNWGITW